MKYRIWGLFLLVGVLSLAGVGAGPATAEAQTACVFYRPLALGSVGEDVRCLQRFLGVSAETGYYGSQTAAAVARWQAAQGLTPASGVFNDLSRAVYAAVYSRGGSAITPGAFPVSSGTEAAARTALRGALDAINDAVDEIDDSRARSSVIDDAFELVDRAKSRLIEALFAGFDRDYREAEELAEEAEELADEAIDEVDGDRDRDRGGGRADAREAIEEAEDAIDDARDEIDDADDDGEDVDEAEDLLDEAEDRLDDARDEYDDGDYDDAVNSAEDAEDLARDAIRAID